MIKLFANAPYFLCSVISAKSFSAKSWRIVLFFWLTMCAINWEKILSTSGPAVVTRKLKIHMGPVCQAIALLAKKPSPPLSLLKREPTNHRTNTLSCLAYKHLSLCLRRISVWDSQLWCLAGRWGSTCRVKMKKNSKTQKTWRQYLPKHGLEMSALLAVDVQENKAKHF